MYSSFSILGKCNFDLTKILWLWGEIPPRTIPSAEKAYRKIPPEENTSLKNTSRHNATKQNTYNLEKAYVQI